MNRKGAATVKVSQRISSSRVRQLREEKNWNQAMLAEKISEKQPECSLTQSFVSMWENNRRNISIIYLKTLQELFDVSADYLLGYTTNRQEVLSDEERLQIITNTSLNNTSLPDEEISLSLIDPANMRIYNEKPIFVDFGDSQVHQNAWALYSQGCLAESGKFVFTDATYRRVDLERMAKVSYYTNDPCLSILYSKKTLSLNEIKKSEYIMVEMITADRYISGLYNGIYHNNENMTALINSSGLVLPYNGLNKSFLAYSV